MTGMEPEALTGANFFWWSGTERTRDSESGNLLSVLSKGQEEETRCVSAGIHVQWDWQEERGQCCPVTTSPKRRWIHFRFQSLAIDWLNEGKSLPGRAVCWTVRRVGYQRALARSAKSTATRSLTNKICSQKRHAPFWQHNPQSGYYLQGAEGYTTNLYCALTYQLHHRLQNRIIT
jgi:hypothetical protein